MLAATLAAPAAADDAWRQWGGPRRDFKSAAKGLATVWPEGGPKLLWQRELGDGFSGIVAEDGRLFTMYRRDGEEYRRAGEEAAVAVDAATGGTLWETRYAVSAPPEMNLEYDVMLANGLMASPTAGDFIILTTQPIDGNNNSKSAGARVGLMPMEGLGIGGSFAWGKYDPAAENNYMLIGGDAHFEMEGLDVRGEVRYQSISNVIGTSAAPAVPTDVTGLFFYGQASYEIPVESLQFIEPTARFAYGDPNSDVDGDQLMQIAVGGTVSPAQGLLLKGEFQINQEDDAVKTDNNAFSLQAVFGWK